jgi:DNA methylase
VSVNGPDTAVWELATVPPFPGKHPAATPLALLRHSITVSSRPGDTGLECCAGSFSTLEAVRHRGRRGSGMEQDPRWARAGVRRLSQDGLLCTANGHRRRNRGERGQQSDTGGARRDSSGHSLLGQSRPPGHSWQKAPYFPAGCAPWHWGTWQFFPSLCPLSRTERGQPFRGRSV